MNEELEKFEKRIEDDKNLKLLVDFDRIDLEPVKNQMEIPVIKYKKVNILKKKEVDLSKKKNKNNSIF